MIYIPICLYLNEAKSKECKLYNTIYIPICLYLNCNLTTSALCFRSIYIPICLYLNRTWKFIQIFTLSIYIPICLYLNIHHPDSRFFSTLFPNFLLTSQSLQIFYHISFINSTKEKKNHLFFMLIEFCRCMGIFTLSEVDSLKIVVME